MTTSTTDNGLTFTRCEGIIIVAIFIAAILTRLPWLSPGYGMDPDAWRVITSARHIAQTGEYVFSRPPGFPVHEYLIALTPAKTSPLYSNGITALFSSVASLFFALILRYFRIKHYLLLTLAFALTPVVYVNSVNTMDYMLALAFILGSTYFVMVHRPFVAGIFLGLAIGSRITSGAMLLPLTLWIFLEERNSTSGRRFAIFSITALMIGSICYLPVVDRYGLDFFHFTDNIGYESVESLLAKVSIHVWGASATLGFLALCCLVPFVFRDIRVAFTQPLVKRGLALSLLSIALYIVAFFRLPHEAAYLIPVVPFVLLSLALLLSPHLLKYFCIALLFSSFFITVSRSGVTLSGPIIQDHLTRQSQIEETSKLIEVVTQLPEKSIIVVGGTLALIQILDNKHQNNHQYVYGIKDSTAFKQYIDQGFQVYFFNDMDRYNLHLYGVDLRKFGAQQLDVLDEK